VSGAIYPPSYTVSHATESELRLINFPG